ncbi:hypothetical protein [Cellulomonas sp. P24]|uniref:hypothetical protein n=1 Tax=Cellulomonas sp. P24 TaxID=2885206 RepID=UPI00216AB666|nr:hypothetical protein [Cellulomonas sp. P24]MCR6493174.1 hypothetical protein [Cellulomonas sp. P24]
MPIYCLCSGPRGQAQIKLKPAVVNNSNATITINTVDFRLLVDQSNIAEWSGQADTPPSMTTISGKSYALFPPNRDSFAERLDGSWTFATHWTPQSVTPGAQYVNWDTKRGDLVVYVPIRPDGSISIVGLAMVDADNKVVAVSAFADWKSKEDPNAF